MLRGHRTYLQLFDEPKQPDNPKPERRGRSESLNRKRNELLIHRYYYYIKIEGKQYIATLDNLENELMLAQQTIVNNVANNRELLKELNAAKPGKAFFKKKYPWLVW